MKKRTLFFWQITLVILSQTGAPVWAFAQKATAVTGVSITVEDLDREVGFFTKVLDFQKIKQENLQGENIAQLFGLPEKEASVQVATLQLGAEQIRLLDFDYRTNSTTSTISTTSTPSLHFNQQTRGNDLWFQHLAIVVSDMDAAYRRLLDAGVTHVSTAPQTLPAYLPNAAGIKAFYFRDPEGHNLELIWFPPGKGNPKWQPQPSNQKPSNQKPLFLGIDHTAIAIADTKQSMVFYRDLLGLTHAGHSENYGTEQEHLNQVFGARLDINGLHADEGFGVEFLRYIAPPGGRRYPAGSQPTDLWHYQTEFVVDQLDNLLQKLEKQGYKIVSTATAIISGKTSVLLRDPDGHAILLFEELR